MTQSKIIIDRFWSYIQKTDSCWIWTAHKDSGGYGKFWNGQKQTPAHRFSYEQLVGKIPVGKQLDHLCRNRVCVNPEHLEIVTAKENILRGISFSAIYAKKTHCKRGHELTGKNLIHRTDGRRDCLPCQRIRYNQRKVKII